MMVKRGYMVKNLLISNLGLLLIAVMLILFVSMSQTLAVVFGIVLSAFSILVNAWVLETFWESNWGKFSKIFFFSLIARFAFNVLVLLIVLWATKIDKIYFTVSFLFSYICNSVIEITFFNKILEKKSSKK